MSIPSPASTPAPAASAAPSGVVRAVYELHGDTAIAVERAEAIAIEQSHELPPRYAPAHTAVSRATVAGVEVVGDGRARAVIDFPLDLIGGELGQLLLVVFGNVALLPGVRLVDLDLPASLVAQLGGGPKLGIAGVRARVDAPSRPILATALKPVGLSTAELAELAYQFALGGIDLIKDDQGLGDQHWAPFEQRVPAIAAAVARANAETGGRSVYLPSFAPPADRFAQRLDLAIEAGAGGVLAVPGATGLDGVRSIAANSPDDFVILTHPAFYGGFATSADAGIAPEVLYGTLLRLARSDAAVFPSYGGRFSYSRAQCLAIAAGARRPLPGLAPALPSPGGGMSLERVPELRGAYGDDTILLIGGELHRDGAFRRNAEEFRALVSA